jgi:class 3 adenylate cyclase/DNA-binding transcriptional MerR regulator
LLGPADPDRLTGVPESALTIDELATAAGEAVERVRRWQQLGLLGSPDGAYSPHTVERIRLIQYAGRRGLSAEDVADACRTQGDVVGEFVALITDGSPRTGHRIEELFERTGLAPAAMRRLWVASGLGDQEEAYDEDLHAQQWLAVALGAGIPEEAVLQLVRVYADAIGRVADAEARLFHYYVHERLRAEGLEGQDLFAAVQGISESVRDLLEPAVLYFHRKAMQRALREDFVLHLTEATTPPGQTAGELQTTMMFVDLAGFTPLTETMGDDTAARIVERFSEIARDAVTGHSGKVVKQIGDEFMLAFDNPTHALGCGLDIDAATRREENFPAVSIGAHYGTLLYREGDYIGTTVNIAARVTATANRQFLITDALRREIRGDGFDVRPFGRHALKGISGEVELYEVSRQTATPARVLDPVCHMALDPDNAPVTLRWRDTDMHFCSTDCALQFEDDPDRYADNPV